MKTDRLILRRFESGDWRDLYDYLSQESVMKYEPYGVFSEEESRREAARRSNDDAFWAVCLTDSGKVIGNIYFQQQEPKAFMTWELGYVFNACYQGKGYATEACRRILQFGFEKLGAHRIIGSCNPENTASWRLLERLGMRREGHFKKPAFFTKTPEGKPLWHDGYQYSILEEEFFSQ